MSNSNKELFKAVKEFAAKYGMHTCFESDFDYSKLGQDEYVITRELTDGDQLTFFVTRVKDVENALYDENVCAAPVDDWEENRPALICKRLHNACVKHGIISYVDIQQATDPAVFGK